MSVLVACDLDGTLIYSRRRAGTAVADGELVCVEYLAGVPASFMTAAAFVGLSELARSAYVVAVTARSRAQFSRIDLPVTSRHTVLANGGLIVEDGRPDPSWSAAVARRLSDAASLREIEQHVADVCRPEWTKKIVLVESLFCCAVIAADLVGTDFFAAQEEWAQARGWRTSVQGSKFYLVPQAVSKSAAVAEIRRRIGAAAVLAAGDAALDADLLQAANRGVHPSDGELAANGWSAPGVTRVPGSGVVGGEQIVDWLRAQLSDLGDGVDVGGAAATRR